MASLSGLRSSKTEKKRELRTQKRKLSKLENIQGYINTKFDGNIDDVNDNAVKCSDNLLDGAKERSHIYDVSDMILGDKELSTSSDITFGYIDDGIRGEIKDTEDKIADLERDISELERDIEDEKDRRREQAKKAISDAFNLN